MTLEVNISPEKLYDLHQSLRRQALTEEVGDPRKLDADAVRERVWAKRAEQERRYRQELDRRYRPQWVSYHLRLAAALDRRAQEHRQRAQELEKETARAV